MKSGLGTSPTMALLLSILAQIAAQIRTWYNDNMAITFDQDISQPRKLSYSAINELSCVLYWGALRDLSRNRSVMSRFERQVRDWAHPSIFLHAVFFTVFGALRSSHWSRYTYLPEITLLLNFAVRVQGVDIWKINTKKHVFFGLDTCSTGI